MLVIDDSTFAFCGATISDDFSTFNTFQNVLNGSYDGFIGILSVSSTAKDTLIPRITSYPDSCGIKFIFIEELQNNDTGIDSFNIIRKENCKIDLLEHNSKTIKIKISLVDFQKNGYYTIKLSINLEIMLLPTIPFWETLVILYNFVLRPISSLAILCLAKFFAKISGYGT